MEATLLRVGVQGMDLGKLLNNRWQICNPDISVMIHDMEYVGNLCVYISCVYRHISIQYTCLIMSL